VKGEAPLRVTGMLYVLVGSQSGIKAAAGGCKRYGRVLHTQKREDSRRIDEDGQ